jgi:ketosteroid isomerase-like protein
MSTLSKTLIELEKKFWQSMVTQDTRTAAELLTEPALMVSSHGAMKFDREGYRKMAQQGTMVLTAFELSDVDVLFPSDTTAIVTYRVKQVVAPRAKGGSAIEQEMNDTSTWVRKDVGWQCAMHTETPVETKEASR